MDNFELKSISITQYAISEEHFDPKVKTTVNSQFRVLANDSESLMMMLAKTTFDSGKGSFIQIEVACEFRLSKKDFKSLITDAALVIPSQLLERMGNVVIGTSRGILFEKLSKTSLSKVHFPLVDVSRAFPTDLELIKQS